MTGRRTPGRRVRCRSAAAAFVILLASVTVAVSGAAGASTSAGARPSRSSRARYSEKASATLPMLHGPAQLMPGPGGLGAVACATATRCFALGYGGVVPLGLSGTIGAPIPVPGAAGLAAIACPTSSTCEVAGTTDASTGRPIGVVVAIDAATESVAPPIPADQLSGVSPNAIACASRHNCVIVGSEQVGGSSAPVAVHLDPTTGALGQPSLVHGAGSLGAVTCPSPSLCVAVGGTSAPTAFSAITPPGNAVVVGIDSSDARIVSAPHVVAAAAAFTVVACADNHDCELVGLAHAPASEATNPAFTNTGQMLGFSYDPLTGRVGGTVTAPPNVAIEGLACVPGSCEAVGFHQLPGPEATSPITGVVGTLDASGFTSQRSVAIAGAIDALACPAASGECIGVGSNVSATDAQGIVVTATSTRAGSPLVPPSGRIQQVVFVHGFNTGCAAVGVRAQVPVPVPAPGPAPNPGQPAPPPTRYTPGADQGWAGLFDALAAKQMQVYSFCYEHDMSFDDRPSWRGTQNERCFSGTGRHTPARAEGLRVAFDAKIGPLYASRSANEAKKSTAYDTDGPIAYDATKLNDCLRQLLNYDIHRYGHVLPVAVIGDSMGGAVTRGWLALDQSRVDQAQRRRVALAADEPLRAVPAVVMVQAASAGSWIASPSKDVALITSAELPGYPNPSKPLLGLLGSLNPSRPGVEDLAPGSKWYRSVASVPLPTELAYYSFSSEIGVEYQNILQQGCGDGVMALGDASPTELPSTGGSEFLPYGPAADRHQFVIRRLITIADNNLGPIAIPVADWYIPLNNDCSLRAELAVYGDPYSHANFGLNTSTDQVQGCGANHATHSFANEVALLLTDPAHSCSAPTPSPPVTSPPVTSPPVTSPPVTSPPGPEAAVTGLLSDLIAGNYSGSCAFMQPSAQSTCSQGAASGPPQTTISGTFSIAGEVVQGTVALVSITGNLCSQQQGGGSNCTALSDPSAGMPSASLPFEEAFSEAYSNNSSTPSSPIPCVQVNGAWYVDTNLG